MSLAILGMGTATPDGAIEQADAAEIAKTFVFDGDENQSVLQTLYRMTLVKRRASVLLERSNGDAPSQSFYPAASAIDDRGPMTQQRMQRYAADATPLALAAARRALDAASAARREITHLITVSCTGFHSPGVDVALIKQLGLSADVGRTMIGFMGCHGALNALRVAQAFVEADRSAKVLVCAVEICSLHYQYGWDPEQVVANALFADGAAALIAGGENGSRVHEGWRVAACGSCLLPDAEDEMTWRIGDHGFEMTLSPRVPHLIGHHLRPWLARWLKRHNLTIDQIGSWAIHPGGPRIIHSVVQSLNLPPQAAHASNQILAEYGNMSSATVLFVVERLQQRSAPLPCVALAFGPGLVAEATLFV